MKGNNRFIACLSQIFILLFNSSNKKIIQDKLVLFIFGSFIASLSPFLLFPTHKSSYYLTLASFWLSVLMALIVSKAWSRRRVFKFLVVSFIAIFIAISYQTTNINKLTYWAAKRAKAASAMVTDIKKNYPFVDKGTIFYIRNDPEYPFIAKEWGSSSKQAFYILSGPDAFKLLFKDPTIQVYFEDIQTLPLTINKEKIINYTPRFPY